MTRFLVLCPSAPGRFDGVADYAGWLTAHLTPIGPAVLVGLPDPGTARSADQLPCLSAAPRVTVASWRELWRQRREAPFADGAVLMQYVPQLWVRGLDFGWFLLWLASARMRDRPVLITVHEYVVPPNSPKRAVAHVLMKGLLALLATLASHIVVTTDVRRRHVRRLAFWKARRIVTVPVGSNIPVVGPPTPTPGSPVTCTVFGQPDFMHAPVVAALGAWINDAGPAVRVRWIARSASAVRSLLARCNVSSGVEILEQPSAATVSALLSSSDVCLAPIVDGVSTRRTTVMAALAHGLPIVGTDGALTEDLFRHSEACLLSAPADVASFVRHVQTVVDDPAVRRRMSAAARTLFADRFTWERIAGAYAALLSG